MEAIAETAVISIHALREEGDLEITQRVRLKLQFLSTPSARRATDGLRHALPGRSISIHALREEGDQRGQRPLLRVRISIHALREEGDTAPPCSRRLCGHFYPRPPRGGRPKAAVLSPPCAVFLSTPSARRATRVNRRLLDLTLFLSTPSARRATLN